MSIYAKTKTIALNNTYATDPDFELPFGSQDVQIYPADSGAYGLITVSFDGVTDAFVFSTALTAPIRLSQIGLRKFWLKAASATGAVVQIIAQN